MKVLANGGLNLSELDGWWAEAYRREVGWAIGDGKDHGEDPAWDAVEAESLYDLLEHEVIPMLYKCNEKGIPVTGIERMRESMGRLTPQFSANRTVREYTEKYYLPAATAYRQREANSGVLAEEVVKWRHRVGQHWAAIRFGSLKVESSNQEYKFAAQVYLNDVLSDSVSVELYAEPNRSGAPIRIPMNRGAKVAGPVSGFVCTQGERLRPVRHPITPCESSPQSQECSCRWKQIRSPGKRPRQRLCLSKI
jgi:glycogen phosphorylase